MISSVQQIKFSQLVVDFSQRDSNLTVLYLFCKEIRTKFYIIETSIWLNHVFGIGGSDMGTRRLRAHSILIATQSKMRCSCFEYFTNCFFCSILQCPVLDLICLKAVEKLLLLEKNCPCPMKGERRTNRYTESDGSRYV